MFKFVVLGAGGISRQFCDAVSRLADCTVVAVASRRMDKAERLAAEYHINHAYDDYAEMLEKEKPDGAYIGVTQNAHYELTMLCVEHRVGVLCEKAMFMSQVEAKKAFANAEEAQVFAMEGLWSRFLPSVQKAKQWIEEGRIGKLKFVNFTIGFIAPKDKSNRYFNPALGGGVGFDITVYAYQLTTFLVNQPILEVQVSAIWGGTGVDVSNQLTLRFPDALASLSSTFEAPVEEKMIIYGDEGYIVLPHPHFGCETILYGADKKHIEHFKDDKTENGFVYQIQEVIDCIKAGKLESNIVPHCSTLECAAVFDLIKATNA